VIVRDGAGLLQKKDGYGRKGWQPDGFAGVKTEGNPAMPRVVLRGKGLQWGNSKKKI